MYKVNKKKKKLLKTSLNNSNNILIDLFKGKKVKKVNGKRRQKNKYKRISKELKRNSFYQINS